MSKRLKPGWKNCSMRPINASSMSKSASARGRMRVDSGFGRVLLCKQPHIVSSCDGLSSRPWLHKQRAAGWCEACSTWYGEYTPELQQETAAGAIR